MGFEVLIVQGANNLTERIDSDKYQDNVSKWDNTILSELIKPHEPLRDPIHGDVWINLLERQKESQHRPSLCT